MNLGDAISKMYDGNIIIKRVKNCPNILSYLKFNKEKRHILYSNSLDGEWRRVDQECLISFANDYTYEIAGII